ncbi:MAG TPA: cation:proton antiporter [Gemmatimonadales bacterium]|jgi:Kef-type K+ transport system membrane component KefB|nr:cation:proton antiporter [Gemmatimonadales bacterium]
MQWVALVFSLGLMGLFQLLTRAGPLEARATLALGFLLLAAHLGGDLAKRFRLPRITGLLVTGLLVGPAFLGLVRGDEVGALGFIGDAAAALIAFTAGSQLNLEMLRQGRGMLARVTAASMLFPLAIVAAVVLSVSPWFPLTVHQPFGDALAVALVLGAIAAASSPTLTVALMDELGARGPVARAVLSVAAAKDAVVIAVFALILLVARPLASGGALDLSVVGSVLLYGVASIAAGVVLGVLISQYLKLLRSDSPLILVAVAFLTAEAARSLNLDVLLIALTAGFYVVTFSPVEGSRLETQLKRAAVPVYALFFALAGAGLQVGFLRDTWGWVVLLVALRALGLRVGTRFAGRSSLVPAGLANHGWLGLISQAGVTFGLAAAARRAFPEWGVSLEALVVAMIGVHEIVGPLCFQRALRLTGEVTEGEHVTQKDHTVGPALVPGSGGM